ncbi:MAG: hypothetical protein ACI4J5_02270 [Oscillospiraceae bacterium]
MSYISGTNTAYYVNTYLKNSGYSFVGSGSKAGGTLTNMLKNSVIKQTSSIGSIKDIYENSSNTSSSLINADEETLSKNAAALQKSTAVLASGSLFEKNSEGEYDREKIAEGVNTMVSDYNKTIKAFQNSENIAALSKGVSMTQTTSAFSGALKRIGVSINSDNTLSVDSKKLDAAAVSDVKSVLSGNYSYSAKISEKAQFVSEAAGSQISGIYNSKGGVSTYSNAILAAMLSLQV